MKTIKLHFKRKIDVFRALLEQAKWTSGIMAAVLFAGVLTVAAANSEKIFIMIDLDTGERSGYAAVVKDATAAGGRYLMFSKKPPATTTTVDDSSKDSASGSSGGSSASGGKVLSLSYPRIPWEGGPNYWKASVSGTQFAKADAAGWDSPNFFPISVFLGKPDDPNHVNSLKDAGINVYMGAEHNPPISNVTSKGIFVLANGNWIPGEWSHAEIANDPKVVGYLVSDECEMGYSGCDGDAAAQLAQQQAYVNQARSYNDGRFLHANFGNGILRTFWSVGTMDDHVQLMDSASADKYTYTSPDVAGIIDGWHDAPDWPNGAPVPRAYSYGWQADQMKRFQDSNNLRPVWTFVETAMPYLGEAGRRTIDPEQIEGAVWSALIHEARGIAYFQHNNNGVCGNYSIVDCPEVHAKVKSINAKVKSLAPVLNTQSYYNDTRVVNGFTYYYFNFNNGTDAMLKTYNGYAYIFAGIGMNQSPGGKTFTLPTGVNGKSVEVVGEGRSLSVNGSRQFTDSFAAEYSHHVYKIAL